MARLEGAALLAAGLFLGCGDESQTTGKRISLDARVEASPPSRDFTNAAGWRVTMSKALVATGPLYYFDGETIFAARSPTQRSRWADVFGLGIKTAHAHPGHYVPGTAKGEMLTATSADLLAGSVLGRGDGISGMVRSATFSFDTPPKGPFASELGSSAIVLEGSAEKGAEKRIFRAEIGFEETKGADKKPQVEGCPFAAVDMESDGVVMVTIDLALWFDQVDFTEEPPSVDGKPVVMPAGLARNQLVRGTKAGLAYKFSYSPR